MPIAVVVAALVGMILAAPVVKLRGDYLLVATIGFNEIFRMILINDVGGVTGARRHFWHRRTQRLRLFHW